ncbi:MAG: hypothetical protein V4819_14525 [Verrucomicrobiota bacterium]
MSFSTILLLGFAALTGSTAAHPELGNAIDTVVFGDAVSESSHAFTTTGSAVFQNELTLYGPGNIWDSEDVLVFHGQKLTGDGWVEARVTSTGETGDWTKIGVMMRESLDANSKNAFMFNSSGHGLHSQWRTDTGGGTGQGDELKLAGAPPYWLRVERKGDEFTMSASTDGKNWTVANSRTIKMTGGIVMGLVNSAASSEKMNYAIFDNIRSSAAAAEWTDTVIGKTTTRGGSMVNGLGEPARRMLPQDPAYYYGGAMAFRIKVDPAKQNYLTAKLWGSDGSDRMGRVILNVEGKEVGMRHGGGLDIFIHNVGAVSPGAFWYRTTILPKWLTEGKTSVEIKLRSVGDLFAYGTPWNYDTYQHKLDQATRGIYRAYSHNDPMFVPGKEVQGTPPDYAAAPVRPALDEVEYFEKFKADKNKQLAGLMEKSDPSQGDASTLADGSRVPWTVIYRKREVAGRVVAALDAVCRKYNADNKLAAAEWGGNFGPTGYALSVVVPAITKELDAKVDLGAGLKSRREQYAGMLRASVDAGRFNRQSITNQAIINAFNIYRANRGLLAMKAREALPEDEARRYYREACGMEEWRGSDLPKGGSKWDAGHGVFMMTAKGTSREWNWCCANCYGRMDAYVYEMYRLTGDTGFRDRALQIQRAHNFMVYPSVDEGGYRAMLNEGVICTRNVYHPGHTYYGYVNIVSSLVDRGLLGAAKQGMADNQLLAGWQIPEASLFLPDDYELVKSGVAKAGPLPPLPTAPGQPDFAWADEQNALVSIKHGRDQHFLTFARRSEGGLHRIADAHSLTPQFERVVQFALDDVRFTDTGEFNTVGPEVESDFTGKPPDGPINAFAGQKLPKLKGRAGSPADFYGVRFGDFLIGMNSSADQTFDFKPAGFIGGVDMVSRKPMKAPLRIPPQTTVVFYSPAR